MHSQIIIAGAALTSTASAVITLQGSLDGANWSNIAATIITTAGVYFGNVTAGVRQLRNYVLSANTTSAYSSIIIQNMGMH